MSLREDVGEGMVFQKPRWMGRVTGRERGGCWEVLSRCSGIRGVCNLCDAKGFPFAPLLLFPHNTAVFRSLFCAAVHLHTPGMLGHSFVPLYPKCCHTSSFALLAPGYSHGC